MKYYDSIQLLTGGGARFGYYLGSYAALVDSGCAPGALLASCGGSLAAWLIMQAPEPKRLYALATSRALHETLMQTAQTNIPPNPVAPLWQAVWRYWQTRCPKRLERLHAADTRTALLSELRRYAAFQSPRHPHHWLQNVADYAGTLPNPQPRTAPDVLIAASRLLSDETKVCFQPIMWVPHNFPAVNPPDNPVAALTAPRQTTQTAIVRHPSYQAAVAASIADMYYQPPIEIEGVGTCMGGVIDLVPLEWAIVLADTVFAESKPPYSRLLAEPAILRVFGTPANLRHAQTSALMRQHPNVHILPFADNRTALRGKYIGKSYDWFSGCLSIHQIDAATFAEYMHAQWQYGYQTTIRTPAQIARP